MTQQFLSTRSIVARFSVLWRQDDGISPTLHRDYIDNLAFTASAWLLQAVDSTADRTAEASWSDIELLSEINQHWLTVRDRVRWFTGRKELVNLVQSYVISDDDKPLILHGPPGVGKSSVMAKVAAEVFHQETEQQR